ncbi:MAG TPA: dTDP-4-dehydrorhamnose 3,5-epimerase, partial [Longimicrobium sp.]
MIFTATELAGAWIVDPERLEDERGFFARTFDAGEFARRGLRSAFPQCSVSFNARAGTLRGMHFQAEPHAEAKLVRCTAGAVYDVIVDLRPESPTRLRWIGVELSAANRRALYVPEGCAHGFQTLADASEVFYQISVPYAAESARGVRWNDPAFGITWPAAERRTMS